MNLYQKKGEYDEMEYIAREALLEQLKAMESYNASPMYRHGYDDCVEAILKTPATDVVPVVHGRWIWHEEEFEYECSACHCRFDYNPTFENFEHGFHYANWCPYCGAKMDGGVDND